MRTSPMFLIVLSFFILCTFSFALVPDVLWFTPLAVFFFSRLRRRESLLIFTLQFLDLFVDYLVERDFILTLSNVFLAIFQEQGDLSHFEWVFPVSFALCILFCYVVSFGLVKGLKLRRRVGA